MQTWEEVRGFVDWSFFYQRQFYKSYTDMKQVGEILLILEIGKEV